VQFTKLKWTYFGHITTFIYWVQLQLPTGINSGPKCSNYQTSKTELLYATFKTQRKTVGNVTTVSTQNWHSKTNDD